MLVLIVVVLVNLSLQFIRQNRASIWLPVDVDFVARFSSNPRSFNEIAACINVCSKIISCLVALLVLEKHFHFGSDTSDYYIYNNVNSNKKYLANTPS